MGEAWFMGSERRTFSLPLTTDYNDLPFDYVSSMLEEIIGGATNMGELPEWREWFLYLLPRTLRHPFETYAFRYRLELTLTAFFAQYPGPIEPAPYRHFRDDVLDTAGRAIMNAELWKGEQLRVGSGIIRESRRYGEEWWYFDRPSPALSASMFFCLKYLAPEQIAGWAISIFAIRCSYWRAQIITWLLGAKPFLEGLVSQPEQFDKLTPEIEWASSHYLKGDDERGRGTIPFVPHANIQAFRAIFKDALRSAERKLWVAQVTSVPPLQREMGTLAEQFLDFRLEA